MVDYRKSGGDLTTLGAFQGVTVDLAAGTAVDPFGATDTLSNIERVKGTHWNDLIFGDGVANRLESYEGNDAMLGEAFNHSIDGFAFQAFRLYQATLDRVPDVPGMNSWANALKNGVPILQVVDGFVNSAEFQSKYGATDNGQFVTLLYNNVLNRSPDPGGFKAWKDYLDAGGSRAVVVNGFSDSAEFISNSWVSFTPFSTAALAGKVTADIFRLYQATLDREPDAGGLVAWTNHLTLGASKLSVVSGFVGSAEFQAKYGATDNGQFVNLLYNNVLNRSPDPGGFKFWKDYLDAGGSRESVVLGFADSMEFKDNTAADVFAFMRGGDTSTLQDLMEGGAGDDGVVGGLGADRFKFVQGEGGSDIVGDLEDWDWVQFNGFGYSDKSDVLAHMTQKAEGVEFEDQGQTILFFGKQISDFTDDTFDFV